MHVLELQSDEVDGAGLPLLVELLVELDFSIFDETRSVIGFCKVPEAGTETFVSEALAGFIGAGFKAEDLSKLLLELGIGAGPSGCN